MKYLRKFESHEDTVENIANIKAVLYDFCEKYDLELVKDYNCYEIRYNTNINSMENSAQISTQEFKADLNRFFKKITAHHSRDEVDKFDINILINGKRIAFTNLFNKAEAEMLYSKLDTSESISILRLFLSVRFTYRYY